MKRVTGIGGVFFKATNPPALGAWYKRHLGIDVPLRAALEVVSATAVQAPGRGSPQQC
ncbi:MAG TPA: hypothetical protein VF046_03795 [Gemmatimonadales bacterium]